MNRSATKALVVDDDPRLRDLLRRYLGDNGFAVHVAENAAAMHKLWLRERYDVLILDLMMPGEDGLSVLRRLRGSNDRTPVIMLTAKGEDVDRIVGLEMGADDYLPKPFNPRELLARIHAVLRRKGADELPGAPAQEAGSVRFGEFELDLATRTLDPQRRADRHHDRRVCRAQGVCAAPEDAVVARETDGNGPRTRVRGIRSIARRADLALAQDDRTGSVQAEVHPDRLGPGIRLHSRRQRLKRRLAATDTSPPCRFDRHRCSGAPSC
jgi:DNA-binding response OmpR family regulator